MNENNNMDNDCSTQNNYDISIGMWILTMLGCSIPFIGLIINIIIACISKNKTQRNWAIANLIIGVVAGLSISFLIIVGIID